MGWWCSFLSQRPLHPQALYILLKNIYSSPSRRTCLNLFWIFLDSLLHLTAPPISSCSFSYHLSVAPAPHLLSQSGTPSTWKSPTPAPRRPPPLVSVPHTVCLYLPPFPASVRPPFLTSSCTQVLLSTWWFSLSLVPPYPLCLCFYIPVCDAKYFHLVRQLEKCMMRSDQINWHNHGSYVEKTAPSSNVNVTDEDKSK